MNDLTRLKSSLNAGGDIPAGLRELRERRIKDRQRALAAVEQSALGDHLNVPQQLKVSQVAEYRDWVDRVSADDAAKLVRDLVAADKFDVLLAIHQEIKLAIKAAKAAKPEA